MTSVLSRLLLLVSLFASSGAFAQNYPDRTVTIVVTSAAGALTDVLTRAVSQKLSQMWNQSVVVENRGGAGYALRGPGGAAEPSMTASPCSPPRPALSPSSRISTTRANCPTTR